MIYQEKETRLLPSFLLIGVVFLLLMSPWTFSMRDLYWNEGTYAAAVNELNHFPPYLTLHGEVPEGSESFPLYPVLAKGVRALGFEMEFSLRVIPVLCLGILVLSVFFCCYTAAGATAGIVGAVVMFTTLMAADKTFEGNPILLGTLGIFSSWLLWFIFGIWRNSWKLAWICSGFIAGLTFYAVGWWGLFMLIVPMLFLRRPLSPWTKPRGIAFIAGLILILFFLFLWGMPRWHAGLFGAFRNVYTKPADWLEYLWQLMSFPFDVFVRLLPWSLFVWAPFCSAIIPLGKNPLLSKYLRTLFCVLFVLLWFSPATRSRDFICLIPPLAVLLGLNYWILVRRYGFRIVFFLKIAAFFTLFGGIGIVFLSLFPEIISTLFPDLKKSFAYLENPLTLVYCVLNGGVAVLLSLWAIAAMFRKNARIWQMILLVFASGVLSYSGSVIPWRAANRTRSVLGLELRNALGVKDPSKQTVYKFSNLPGLYSECHYMGTGIITVNHPSELPSDVKTVYVLSTEIPSAPDRTWTKLFDRTYKDNRLTLWKGELRMDYQDDN